MANIESGTINFQGKTGKISGFLAKPMVAGTKTAILVVQEWWGVSQFVKEITRSLANDGHVALAVDLYDGKIAANPEQAMEYKNSLRDEKAMNYLTAGLNYLKNLGVKKIGVIGFCMGGRLALIFSTAQKVDALVDFYGAPIPEQLPLVKDISSPIMAIFGGKDKSIPEEDVNNFRRELVKNDKPNKLEIYPNVGHAFFNHTRPEVYNKDASLDVWPKVLNFFKENLK